MVLKIEPVLFSLVILDLNAKIKADVCSPRHLVTYTCPPLHSGDSADLNLQYKLSAVLMKLRVVNTVVIDVITDTRSHALGCIRATRPVYVQFGGHEKR